MTKVSNSRFSEKCSTFLNISHLGIFNLYKHDKISSYFVRTQLGKLFNRKYMSFSKIHLLRESLQSWIVFEMLWDITFLFITDIDATGKPRAGLFKGDVYMLGSYDECRNINGSHYCTLLNVEAKVKNDVDKKLKTMVI